jgi:hypothetical protein
MQIKGDRVAMAMPSTGVIVAMASVGMAEVTSASRGVGEWLSQFSQRCQPKNEPALA